MTAHIIYSLSIIAGSEARHFWEKTAMQSMLVMNAAVQQLLKVSETALKHMNG